MRTIKTIITVAAAFVAGGFIACADTGEKHDGVTVLTEEQYKSGVEDFSTSGWEYLGDTPAIVDFYADWCGPCRKLAPIMDELAAEYAGKVRFYKVNVDNAKALSAAYGIRSIPSVLFIPADGGVPQMNVGLMSKEEFRKKIDGLL